MGYTDVFGGELLFPSQLSYLLITTAVDIELQWPREQQIEGGNVVADFLDIDATAGSLNISMPDARNASTGNKTTINNVGANDFDIVDSTGGPIQTVMPGLQWVLVLTDNSTEAGTWSTFQLGSTVSQASAAALAGAGIKSITNTLNQKIDSDIEGLSPITVVDGDRAKCLIWTGGAGQADLPDPGVVMDDWFFMLRNSGTGTLTVVPPSGTIDGSSDITLEPNGSTFIFTDGTDFFTVGFTSSSTIGFDFVSLPVPGSGDFVLSGANVDRISYRFTGALTGNRRIVVPNTTQQYWCENQTTGAFALTISTPAQVSPPEVEQGETAIFSCDSVNVINAVNATTISLPLSVVQGGTGANNPTDARNNLEAAHDELDMIAGSGLIGGGLLQADVTFNVGAGLGVGVNADDVFLDLTTVSVEVPAAGDFIAFQDIDDSDITKKATIADLVDPTPSQLFDSADNLRASAEPFGVLKLHSVADTDAEVRVLSFTHQDGTVRGQAGYNTANADILLQNLITGGDTIIRAGLTGGEVRLESEDVPFIRVTPTGPRIRGLLNDDAALFWTNAAGGTDRASIGFDTNSVLTFKNLIDSGSQAMRFEGEATGPVTRTMVQMDPDNDVSLWDEGVEVFQTRTPAQGGARANNLNTGGGFERVLTTSDLGGGGSAFRGAKAYQFGISSWPLNNTPNFSAGGPPGLAEAAAIFQTQVFDTDAIWSAGQPTRFITPAGVSRVKLRAGYVINGDTSGGYRHMRFRLNGTLTLDPAQGNWVSHTEMNAPGSGSWWGGIAQSGTITVANPGTDYFEVYVLRQNSSGFTIANTVWMEMEIVA